VETLRRDFVAGLLVFVPVGFTILGVLWILRQLDNLVLPQVFRALGLEGRQPPLVGVIATLALILLFGALTRSFVGRTFIRLWERTVKRIPIARSLYTVLKQFMEAVFGTKGSTGNFRRVVLIEYPRRGIYSYAFVTGRVTSPNDGLPDGLLQVFVPSTPNPTTGYFLLVPTTGYFLLVPEADTIETGLGVEEAFRLIISAGIASGEGKAQTAPRSSPAVEAVAGGGRSP
jgi:uncharacterized membrane protein